MSEEYLRLQHNGDDRWTVTEQLNGVKKQWFFDNGEEAAEFYASRPLGAHDAYVQAHVALNRISRDIRRVRQMLDHIKTELEANPPTDTPAPP